MEHDGRIATRMRLWLHNRALTEATYVNCLAIQACASLTQLVGKLK